MTDIVLKSEKETTPELRIVWGEVYAPNRPDAHGDFMTAESIRKMAHEFARSGRMDQIDVMHDNNVVSGLHVVESFIARKGDPTFIEDAWVIGMHVPDDALWEKIKKHEINGFSMEALVTYKHQDREIEVPEVISGMTTKAEEHEHQFFVKYDDDMNFKGGVTSVVNGHSHVIKSGTHTEDADGHRHRFSSVDVLKIVPEELLGS